MRNITELERAVDEVFSESGFLAEIREKLIKDESIATRIVPVGRNTLYMQGNAGDGDVHIALINEDNYATAVLGISCGLEDYYKMLFEDLAVRKEKEQHQKYADAIEKMHRKYIVTQIQGIPGMGEYRKEMKWKEMLLATAEEIIQKTGVGESFILPAELNLWLAPAVRDWLSIGGMSQPKENVMKRNYDKLAERSGYERVPELSGVYRKGVA